MSRRGIQISIISLFVFILLFASYVLIEKNNYFEERERYGYIAQREVDNIVTTVDCVMARTVTLRTLVQDHEGDTDFFDDLADEVYKTVQVETGVALKNIALAPAGTVTNVYPLEGNESLIGFNFFDINAPGNREAVEAYEKGATVLTNPFELVQGGRGMAGRTPVMIDKIGKKGLWGLVTVTIDYDNLIKVLNLKDLSMMGISYELAFYDDDGKRVIMESDGSIGETPVISTFLVRNLKWELAIAPNAGWYQKRVAVIVILIMIVVSFFVGQFVYLIMKLRETNANLLYLSSTDKLTRFYNRRAYEEDVMNMDSVPKEKDFVYASLDVNGLKTVNDLKGHEAGDELISGAAECIRSAFEKYGRIYRMGGDEFAIIFHADSKQLEKIKANIDSSLENWKGENVDSLAVSIGYAAKSEFPDSTITELAKIADQRMYQSKEKYYQTKGIDRRSQQAAYNALCDSYAKILLVNIADESFELIKINQDDMDVYSDADNKISNAFMNYVNQGRVFEEDVNSFIKQTDISLIRNRFNSGSKEYTIHYRRKKGNTFEEAMMEMIPVNDYAYNNQKVFLFVKSIG